MQGVRGVTHPRPHKPEQGGAALHNDKRKIGCQQPQRGVPVVPSPSRIMTDATVPSQPHTQPSNAPCAPKQRPVAAADTPLRHHPSRPLHGRRPAATDAHARRRARVPQTKASKPSRIPRPCLPVKCRCQVQVVIGRQPRRCVAVGALEHQAARFVHHEQRLNDHGACAQREGQEGEGGSTGSEQRGGSNQAPSRPHSGSGGRFGEGEGAKDPTRSYQDPPLWWIAIVLSLSKDRNRRL